jgi:hypothetical protein
MIEIYIASVSAALETKIKTLPNPGYDSGDAVSGWFLPWGGVFTYPGHVSAKVGMRYRSGWEGGTISVATPITEDAGVDADRLFEKMQQRIAQRDPKDFGPGVLPE